MKIEYDPLGRRITKTVGETVYHYTWSGDQLIEIRDGDGNLLKFIIYGNNLDEPIVMMGGAVTSYFTTDGLGSISEITNEYGGLEEYYTYDAYGAPSLFDGTGTPISTSAANNPFYFTGREYDFETGIYYYRARYYDPALGRFLETDPLGYINSPNLYTYVGNNPLNWMDPFGLTSFDVTGGHESGNNFGPPESQGRIVDASEIKFDIAGGIGYFIGSVVTNPSPIPLDVLDPGTMKALLIIGKTEKKIIDLANDPQHGPIPGEDDKKSCPK